MKSNTLYVGNLSNYIDNEKLAELFSQFGRVIKVNKNSKNDFGYISMENDLQAKNAKEALDCTNQKGRIIRVILSNTN
jgi:RNA recognition motif-containing protein